MKKKTYCTVSWIGAGILVLLSWIFSFSLENTPMAILFLWLFFPPCFVTLLDLIKKHKERFPIVYLFAQCMSVVMCLALIITSIVFLHSSFA